ncbi:MAG TPA: G-D-S-L family lipolytic protein [Bacteroidetes bacterium]|nr:G-D-S-L family lipolytic protein [Bacteroidota bacterium]
MKNSLFYISFLLNLLFIAAFLFALNKYGGWKNLWSKINNRGVEKLYMHRKNLFEMLPEKDSSIVFLGNSITAYGEWAEFFENINVVNRGIPGDHCDAVRERLDEIKKLNPKKLFLMIGVNDLAFHPPETVALKYEKLLQALLKKMPETNIYLQSVFPVNNIVSPVPVTNADILKLNKNIEKLAKKYSLTFLDTHSLLLDTDGNLDAKYTLDGIHINGSAYMVWKNFLLPEING